MRLWMIVSVLVLASCTKKEPEPAPVEAAEVEAAATQAPVEAEAAGAEPSANPWDSWGEPGLTLIEPGKAPLRKLRRTFKKGRKATIDLQVKDRDGMILSYVVSLETSKVSKDGAKATVTLRVDEPALLKGLRGQYTVDALGGIADFEIELPSDVDPQTQSVVDNLRRFLPPVLAVPLPEEGVGEGAQWSVFETVQDGPAMIAMRTQYELRSLDGSKAEVSLKFEEALDKSQTGAAMTLLALRGAGSGAMSFNLGKIVPDTAKREGSRDQRFATAGTDRVFVISIQIATQLTSR